MLALGIRYLCGWAVATDPTSYDEPEWPPHPARVLMALAAAHFETEEDSPAPEGNEERAALEWLEKQGAPALHVSEAHLVDPVDVHVPVNDTEISSRTDPTTIKINRVKELVGVLPDRRSRQPRTFPKAIPHDDEVWLVWPDAEADPSLSGALGRLCHKVTRIGHSSSFVQMWVGANGEAPAPNLVPDTAVTTQRLRVPASGFLEELASVYEAGLRPSVSLWARYGQPFSTEAPMSVFSDDLIVLRLVPGESRFERLGLEATSQVIDYFRRAVISAAAEPVPEYISGHQPDGSPSQQPHLAFLPLGFVGHRHADGHLLGLAVALPRELSPTQRRKVDEAMAALVSHPEEEDAGQLVMGRLGRWRLEPVTQAAPPWTLRPETWTGPSSVWASVTPVVLDRFTDDDGEKQELVAKACEHVGLPRPSEIRLSHISPFRGVPPSPEFGPLPTSRGRTSRPFTHVLIGFADEEGEALRVRGPVLIGAGRYRGYGLLRPYRRLGG